MDFSYFGTEMETFFGIPLRLVILKRRFFGYSNGKLSNFKINDTVREWF